MGHNASWKNPSTHITYNRGDKIVITGTVYYSADGTSGTHGYYSNYTCYFYSYYTASWTVRVPICIGNSAGTAWAFVDPSSIKSGGTPETHTVSYNANGGSGAPGGQTKYYGTSLTLSSTKPTRTGYTFKNWNTKADGSGTSYAAGGKYSVESNVTLYAQWTRISYAVTYNANGGSGAPGGQTKYYGTSLTLSSTKPTRTGYTFKNWNTKADGSGTSYAAGASYTGNAALALYAQWTAITYKVSYDANGGSGAPGEQTKTHGVTLILSTVQPTRYGYKFTGWNTKADGSGTSYAAGASYTGNAALTLYAQWEVDNICAVRTGTGWKYGIAYVKVNGKWVMGEHVYVNANGKWHMGIR